MSKDNLDQILPKIAKLKAELKAVTRGSENPYFNSKYADLNAHLDIVEPLAEKYGMVLLQPVQGSRVTSALFCIESGQSMSSWIDLPNLPDMQKVGGAITYARRYGLSALLSMKSEDDDGNQASGKSVKPPKIVKSKTISTVQEEF